MNRLAPLLLACIAASAGVGAHAQDVVTAQNLAPLPAAIAEAAGETIPAPSQDPLLAMAEAQSVEIGVAIDAIIAQNIITLGTFTGLSAESWMPLNHSAPTQADNPFAPSRNRMFSDPGLTLNDLTRHQFGSTRGLAIGLEQQLVDSRNMAANVRLRHASGPLDLRVNFRGNKALDSATEMRLSYDSSAVYNLNHALAVGVKARGSLGTFDHLAPATTHDAGAFARLSLLGKGGALSAETGYDVKVGPDAPPSAGQVRANLNLRLKL